MNTIRSNRPSGRLLRVRSHARRGVAVTVLTFACGATATLSGSDAPTGDATGRREVALWCLRNGSALREVTR